MSLQDMLHALREDHFISAEENKPSLMECFIRVAPYINDLTVRDVAVVVTDRERYIFEVPGKEIDFRLSYGDPLKEGTLLRRSMESGQTQSDYVDNHNFGFAYIGSALPIRDDESGEIIGSVFFGENTSDYDALREMAGALADNTNEVNVSTQEINDEAQRLSELGQELSQITQGFVEHLKEVDHATDLIGNISKQTNLLGINAAIESARVGEAGKGFQVVADEIRKLSADSSHSAQGIQEMLDKIKNGSQDINHHVTSVKDIAMSLAEILQNIASSIEDINAMVEELSSTADNLSIKA